MNIFAGILMDDPRFVCQIITFCESNKVAVLSSLPLVAAEMAGMTDFQTMLNFLDDFGGKRLYISSSSARFAKKINIEDTLILHARLRRLTDDRGFIDVPSLWGVYTSLRRAAIRASLKNGDSKEALIREFGVSSRTLRNLNDQRSA